VAADASGSSPAGRSPGGSSSAGSSSASSASAGSASAGSSAGSAEAPAAASGAAAPPAGGGRPSSQSGPDPLIGRVVNDRFRIVAMIARGGMGKVYRAEQAPLGREVALKVLNPNYSGDSDPEFHKRFFLEASTTAKLTHPNTVSIFDYGRTDDDVYYIAMELLEGKTLHRALRESGPMDAARTLHVARQVCRSLREAHGLGVIHRDLKPANIYLVKHGDEHDFVKVLDFGLVKNLEDKGEDLTQTGLFMGSPKYMSPEQIRGERVDGRADVYALGVIMYEMLTGKVPFDRPNSVNILMAHVHEPPPPMREINPRVSVPPLLEQIVMKTMAKSADDRFASMDELLVALKQVGADNGLGLSMSREMSGEFLNPHATGSFQAVSVGGDPLSQSGSGPRATPSITPSGSSLASGALGASTPGMIGTPSVEAPAPRSPVPMIVAALSLVVLLVVGVVAYVGPGAPAEDETDVLPIAGGDPATPGDGTGTGGEAATKTGSGASTPQPPPTIEHTLVTLRSTPTGAMVTVDAADGERREYGPTPADVEWTAADAARGREVTFHFELRGHRDMTVTRTITGDVLEVSAELEAVAAGRPFRPRPPRRPDGRPDGPVGPIKGYKLDPY
jgi:serine/threonine protein kinase